MLLLVRPWLGILVAVAIATPATAIDVTTCGQTVPAGEVGMLVNDLACPTTDGGVILERNAKLFLNGHRITGGTMAVLARGPGRYGVYGPGEVSGALYQCIAGILYAQDEGRTVSLAVWDVTISGCPLTGVSATKLDLRNVVVTGNGVIDVEANTWSGSGISASREVRLSDSLVEQNAAGIVTNGKVKASNTIIRDNRSGISARKSVTGAGLTVTGNWATGISAGTTSNPATLKLRDSVVIGNSIGGDYRDLVALRPPRLRNTVCGTSAKLFYDGLETWWLGGTWGVCQND